MLWTSLDITMFKKKYEFNSLYITAQRLASYGIFESDRQ